MTHKDFDSWEEYEKWLQQYDEWVGYDDDSVFDYDHSYEELKINWISRKDLIDYYLDLMNEGVIITEEQLETLKSLSK